MAFNHFTEKQVESQKSLLRAIGTPEDEILVTIQNADKYWNSANNLNEMKAFLDYMGYENNIEQHECGLVSVDFTMFDEDFSFLCDCSFKDFVNLLYKHSSSTCNTLLESLAELSEGWFLAGGHETFKTPDENIGI